jgi:rRNA-processing protein FCF1
MNDSIYVVLDTNVIVRAARVAFAIGGELDARDRREAAEASHALWAMGKTIDLGAGVQTLRPVICKTVLDETDDVLRRLGADDKTVAMAVKAAIGLVERSKGLHDPTGTRDPEQYRKAMSRRSRQNWGTGAGDEAVLDAARRCQGAILTEDGNFGDYARRRGTRVLSTRDLANVQPAVLQAA